MNTTASAIAPIGPYFCHNACQGKKLGARIGGRRKAGVQKKNTENNPEKTDVTAVTSDKARARKLPPEWGGKRARRKIIDTSSDQKQQGNEQQHRGMKTMPPPLSIFLSQACGPSEAQQPFGA